MEGLYFEYTTRNRESVLVQYHYFRYHYFHSDTSYCLRKLGDRIFIQKTIEQIIKKKWEIYNARIPRF